MPAAQSCLIPVVIDRLAPVVNAATDPYWAADLRKHLTVVPDPRERRGVRHSIGSILALAAAAVAAGAQSFTAIGEWAADAPQPVLAALGARFDPRQARHVAPNEATVRRVATRLDGDVLDDVISSWLTSHTTTSSSDPAETTPAAIAVDGKSLRGTFARTGGAGVHLLAAITHETATVLGQRQVPAGSREIAWFQPLLDTIDLTGRVITADALHTTADHARYLHQRGPDYVFTVKENQHRLHGLLDTMPLARDPRPPQQRQRTRPQRTPHRPARTPRRFPRLPSHRLPPRHPRVPHRALHHLPHEPETLRPHRTRDHQPHRPLYAPRPHRKLRPQPLAHRKQTPLGPRRHLQRRPIPHPHRHRTPRHGHPPQPRHQRTPPPRRPQHRPSTPPHHPRRHPSPHPARNTHLNSTNDFAGTLPGRVGAALRGSGAGCAFGCRSSQRAVVRRDENHATGDS